MGQHLVTHDPCDPSDFRDPFDPWPMTHRPISCSAALSESTSLVFVLISVPFECKISTIKVDIWLKFTYFLRILKMFIKPEIILFIFSVLLCCAVPTLVGEYKIYIYNSVISSITTISYFPFSKLEGENCHGSGRSSPQLFFRPSTCPFLQLNRTLHYLNLNFNTFQGRLPFCGGKYLYSGSASVAVVL